MFSHKEEGSCLMIASPSDPSGKKWFQDMAINRPAVSFNVVGEHPSKPMSLNEGGKIRSFFG